MCMSAPRLVGWWLVSRHEKGAQAFLSLSPHAVFDDCAACGNINKAVRTSLLALVTGRFAAALYSSKLEQRCIL